MTMRLGGKIRTIKFWDLEAMQTRGIQFNRPEKDDPLPCLGKSQEVPDYIKDLPKDWEYQVPLEMWIKVGLKTVGLVCKCV